MEEQDTVRAFWGRLVEAPLGFDEGTGVAPRWPDPAYPQQMHLDLLVEDLDAAEADVLAHGATKLRDSGTFRVYSDPIGHPFCLYYDTTGRAAQELVHLGVLWRVVIDCPDPAVLANFWSGLVDLPERSTTPPTASSSPSPTAPFPPSPSNV